MWKPDQRSTDLQHQDLSCSGDRGPIGRSFPRPEKQPKAISTASETPPSFPNYLPLGHQSVDRIAKLLDPVAFERLYGGWWHSVIASNAKAAMVRSVSRYLDAIGGRYPDHSV